MGETAFDSLTVVEQGVLRDRAASNFPDHGFSVRSNEDGIDWVVLDPHDAGPAALRFTICRLDHCVVVMAEDAANRRQFCSTASVEDAVGIARLITDQAILAVMNAHAASPTLQ